MISLQQTSRPLAIAAAMLAAALAVSAPAFGDTITLKNGIVYRGTIDRDKPVIWIYDGLKRIVIRDSKVERVESDAAFRTLETFRIEQPLVVHGGAMPKELISVTASPWNDRGRRTFDYEGSRLGKTIRMEQAINELGPHLVKIRGVDGYWQSQLATSQVPRPIVLAILGKVDQSDKNERIRVARFLIQSEWYAEARAELDRIVKDFPGDDDLKARAQAARTSVSQVEAVQIRGAIDGCMKALQPKEAMNLLRTFPTKDVSNDLLTQVRELLRREDDQAAADKALADDLVVLSDQLPSAAKPAWKKPTLEVLEALKEAPDAVRDRLVAWQKARLEGGKGPDKQFALAMSGYVVGPDAAVEDMDQAKTFWAMRDEVQRYLVGKDEPTRTEPLSKLDASPVPPDPATPDPIHRLDLVTRIAVHMAPPLHDAKDAKPNAPPKRLRVRDDDNAEPTEYLVTLPPEYHPLRSYPAVVSLHDGKGPAGAVNWCAAEAAKRGYIVIAPEYKLAGDDKEYHYSTNEHAAVELAIRDARRRFAIDSDRIYLAGQLAGGNMAWDFGLAHPELFAGVVVISGLPFKYVNRYLGHIERMPLYVVEGSLAPAANEVVFGQVLKPLIATRAWDVTYVEYLQRGMEDFPEEAKAAFDWMDRRHREPYPKAFNFVTARDSDNRFYGIVIRQVRSQQERPGRTGARSARILPPQRSNSRRLPRAT